MLLRSRKLAPPIVAGKSQYYVQDRLGTTDLPVLPEPPYVQPMFQSDAGVQTSLANNRAYNYIRNSGFWFKSTFPTPAAGTGGVVITNTDRTIMFDGWGFTAVSSDATAPFTCNRLQATSDLLIPGLSRAPYYNGQFQNALDVEFPNRYMVTQVLDATDTAALRGQTVRFQARVLFLPSETRNGFSSSTSTVNPPSTKNARPGIRIALAMLSGATPDQISSPFVTDFISTPSPNTASIPTLGANLSYIAPLARGVDGGTTDPFSVIGPCQGDRTITLNRANPRGPRVGGLWQIPMEAQNLIVMIFNNRRMDNPTALVWENALILNQVSLTIGESIQEWQPMSLAEEQARCQRFACSSFASNDMAQPTQGAGLAGAVKGYCNADSSTAGQIIPIRFPVEMRVPPTITLYNPVSANALVRNLVRATDSSAAGTANIETTGADVTFTGQGGSPGVRWLTGQAVAIHYSATAEL